MVFKKYIKKNYLLDLKITFKIDPYFKYDLKEVDVENSTKFVNFEKRPLQWKQEIKLNDYLKCELEKVVILINRKSEIDVSKIDTETLKYRIFILTNIGGDHYCSYQKDYSSEMAILKKIPKKNCNTDFNKFSIKIIHTDDYRLRESIKLGLTDVAFDPRKRKNSYNDRIYNNEGVLMAFYLSLGTFGIKSGNGDIISLKYNSIKGDVSIFKNGKLYNTLKNIIDIKKDYHFFVELSCLGDCVEIVDNPY